MTSSEFQLKSLSIKAFRGFRDEARFDLDASAIVLTGPNGTGKTSFFDALQWILLGRIERLESLRSRKNVEHIVNRYRFGDPASVSLEVSINEGEVTLRRRGDYKGSTLEVTMSGSKSIFGEAAEQWVEEELMPGDPGSLAVALRTCGLLQQDVMRSVLEAKPADRYAHISSVLGLADLEGFEKAALEASKEADERRKQAEEIVAAARRDVQLVSERLETLMQRALRGSAVEVATDEITRLAAAKPASITFTVPLEPGVEQAIGVATSARVLLSNLLSLLRDQANQARIRDSLEPEPASEEIAQIEGALASAQSNLEALLDRRQQLAESLAAAESVAEETSRLAAAALPLLSAVCPVCGQAIDEDHVAAELHGLMDESTSLVELRVGFDSAEDAATEASANRDDLSSRLSQALALRDRWADLKAADARIGNDLRSFAPPTENGLGFESLSVGQLRGGMSDEIQFLERVAQAFERYGDVLRESRSTGDADRSRSELARAQALLDDREAASDLASARASRLKQLADAATRARVEVTSARFEAIEPLVADIFSRLDPHPAFKKIGFNHDVRYRKGASTPVVSDLTEGVQADPLMVFSASQANIAALSYFLAMSLGAGDRALPFVLLDDPLQSMDDVNVLGFADLCRFLRSDRQLILSTHDPRFANLLGRKLAPRRRGDRTIVYKFTGWDRRGPTVDSESLTYREEDSLLRLLPRSA